MSAPEFQLKAGRSARECPPSLPFALAVGITGHRQNALPAGSLLKIEERLRGALESLANTAAEVHAANAEFFSDAPPRLLFVSPLADGADQLAARSALDLGFELHAILPFERDEYLAGLEPGKARETLVELLGRASCVVELPGDRAQERDAYVMAGRATVAHSDVLIAVWDGLPARGRGGTAEVVQFAFERATPVLHLPVAAAEPAVLRWSAFEPAVVTHHDDSANVRSFGDDELKAVITGLVAPPRDAQERRFIRTYQEECRRRVRTRIEYPLMLAAAGVSRFRRHHWLADLCVEQSQAEWRNYSDACARANAVSAPLTSLQLWYEWADSLAGHFAQSYRSGHVFNFALGALAVLLGTGNLIFPRLAIFLEVGLFLAVLAILANTWAANRGQWHRRWLDYRQLAERLRPMRSLNLLAVAAPEPPGTPANPVPQRWIEWYAAAVWRAIGCPAGCIDASQTGKLTETIADQEVEPQVTYHRKAARQLGRLNHRLEILGYMIFSLSLLSSAVLIAAFILAPGWVKANYNWFTVISAGLPAIGTAVVGIRVQGDHSASAIRSEQTAEVLGQIGDRLRAERSSLLRAADLTEQAARAMLSDLDEWRLLNQQHDLSIG